MILRLERKKGLSCESSYPESYFSTHFELGPLRSPYRVLIIPTLCVVMKSEERWQPHFIFHGLTVLLRLFFSLCNQLKRKQQKESSQKQMANAGLSLEPSQLAIDLGKDLIKKKMVCAARMENNCRRCHCFLMPGKLPYGRVSEQIHSL